MSTVIDPDPPSVADTFDIEGDWEIVYSPEFNREPVPEPPGRFGQPYHVHFETVGPGDHGGVRFKGPFVDDPVPGPPPHSHPVPAVQPGVLYGETIYNGRGTHLVHMVMRYDDNRYFQAHSGAHWGEAVPGVWVRGGWVDVGHPLTKVEPQRSPYHGQFRMMKL
jgi:hypothetical protein